MNRTRTLPLYEAQSAEGVGQGVGQGGRWDRWVGHIMEIRQCLDDF